MCAKLNTAAASNNRDHVSQSVFLLLARATYIMVLFFVHISFMVNHTFNTNANVKVATVQLLVKPKQLPLTSIKLYVNRLGSEHTIIMEMETSNIFLNMPLLCDIR